jgi:hypothetical protein
LGRRQDLNLGQLLPLLRLAITLTQSAIPLDTLSLRPQLDLAIAAEEQARAATAR